MLPIAQEISATFTCLSETDTRVGGHDETIVANASPAWQGSSLDCSCMQDARTTQLLTCASFALRWTLHARSQSLRWRMLIETRLVDRARYRRSAKILQLPQSRTDCLTTRVSLLKRRPHRMAVLNHGAEQMPLHTLSHALAIARSAAIGPHRAQMFNP